MNVDFIKENIDQILEHYSDFDKPIIKAQIVTMLDFIVQEKEVYLVSKEASTIIDKLLTKVINGDFL